MKTGRITYILLLLLTVTGAYCQSITGRVTEESSGEPIVGVAVYVPSAGKATVTDIDGNYTLNIAKGTYEVNYSYIGYEAQEHRITVEGKTTKNVSLKTSAQEIDEVIVVSENWNEKLKKPEMGVEKISAGAIKSVPALLGETDAIKVMQLMPGVQAASEGSTGFSVRGGNPDQNLVLLDGATIYNAGHFMGFFSVFNNDATSDVKLYKGDMPANYGGRLASTLEVNMKDGDKQKYHATGGIGIISSRLTLDGPIVKDRTSLMVSGRRTYFDMFLPFATEESARESEIYFYDLNARLSHKINDNNHLFVSGYLGRDVFEYPIAAMGFGNRSLSIRWSHIYNQRHYMNISANIVKSDYMMTMDFDAASKASMGSVIKDYGMRAEWNSKLGNTHELKYGITIVRHDFEPGTARGEGEAAMIGKIEMPKNRGLETSAYISNTENAGEKINLRYGLRLSTFHNFGPTTLYSYDEQYELEGETEKGRGFYNHNIGLEPRVAISYVINEENSVKTSYTRSYQYLQQATTSTSGTPMDVWYMTSPNVKPQLSDQISVGYFRMSKNRPISYSLEAFYKKMRHTIDFKDHPQVMLNKHMEGELRFGSSRSFGAELMVKYDIGRCYGWLSYTLSRADRKIEGVNEGKRYLSPYNHTHDVSAVASYRISERVSMSGNWVFISGAPTTLPVSRYEVGGEIVPLYSSRNRDQLPHYHRLDLSVTIQCKNNPYRRWKGEWVFSFYNAYNRHNTWAIRFERPEGNEVEETPIIKAKSVYLFPIIPSVSYNFKF